MSDRPAASINFRTRTGQARRSRTRAKILSAAFALFDEAGVDKVTVEDVREAAGLSRGSFYNYFLTYEEMLKELAGQIARQINIEQSAQFEGVPDLLERMWLNIRYFILRAASDRSCGEILVRITPLVGPLNETMRQHAEESQRRVMEQGRVDVPSAGVALDLGLGLCTMIVRRAMHGGIDAAELEATGLMLLRAFGVVESEARRIASLPLTPLPQAPLRQAIINSNSWSVVEQD